MGSTFFTVNIGTNVLVVHNITSQQNCLSNNNHEKTLSEISAKGKLRPYTEFLEGTFLFEGKGISY